EDGGLEEGARFVRRAPLAGDLPAEVRLEREGEIHGAHGRHGLLAAVALSMARRPARLAAVCVGNARRCAWRSCEVTPRRAASADGSTWSPSASASLPFASSWRSFAGFAPSIPRRGTRPPRRQDAPLTRPSAPSSP